MFLETLVSQARLTLSYARRAEDVERAADRATRKNKGPASSRKSGEHRGRRHRLAGSLADKPGSCMHVHVAARARVGAPADPRHTKLIQKLDIKNPEDNKYEYMFGYRQFTWVYVTIVILSEFEESYTRP